VRLRTTALPDIFFDSSAAKPQTATHAPYELKTPMIPVQITSRDTEPLSGLSDIQENIRRVMGDGRSQPSQSRGAHLFQITEQAWQCIRRQRPGRYQDGFKFRPHRL
jgi:hypothetical protein